MGTRRKTSTPCPQNRNRLPRGPVFDLAPCRVRVAPTVRPWRDAARFPALDARSIGRRAVPESTVHPWRVFGPQPALSARSIGRAGFTRAGAGNQWDGCDACGQGHTTANAGARCRNPPIHLDGRTRDLPRNMVFGRPFPARNADLCL